MNSRNYSLLSIGLFLLLSGCIRHSEEERSVNKGFNTSVDRYPYKLNTEYATGFSVKYFRYWKELRIGSDEVPGQKLLLLERGAPVPEGYEDWPVVDIPVDRVACQSTTHLAMLAELDAYETIVGFAQTDLIRDEKLKNMVADGSIRELAGGRSFDVEQVIDADPDVLFTFPFEQRKIEKLGDAGIQQIWQAEYLEKHPLAQAEWLKFMAVFLNKEEAAKIWFDEVEKAYLSLKETADRLDQRPTVFLEIPYKGDWYMAPGNSNMGQLIKDAGADYIWEEETNDGNLALTFEEVFDVAYTCDHWLITGDFDGKMDRKMLIDIDSRFSEFNAYPGGVLVNDLHLADRYTEGVLEPHVILADLIHQFHPGLLTAHDPIYFQKLK